MQKSSLAVLMPLLIFVGPLNAAEQAKSGPPANPLGACALITKTEVQEAMGQAVSNGLPEREGDKESCTFTAPKNVVIKLFVNRSSAKRDFSKALEQVRQAIPDAVVREVPGIGEKALLVEPAIGGATLSVYRGGDTLVVSILEFSNRAHAIAAAEKIAREAYKRF